MSNPATNPAPPDAADMPTDRGSKITPEQKKLIEGWFEKKAQKHNPTCPICGTGNWTILADFVMPSPFTPGPSMVFGGAAYPHFMLACTNCGNVQLINAYGSGILSSADPIK